MYLQSGGGGGFGDGSAGFPGSGVGGVGGYPGGGGGSLFSGGGGPFGSPFGGGAFPAGAAGGRGAVGGQQTGGAFAVGAGAGGIGQPGMVGYNMGHLGGMGQMHGGHAGMGMFGGGTLNSQLASAGLPGQIGGTGPAGGGGANAYFNPAARLGAGGAPFGGMPAQPDPYGNAGYKSQDPRMGGGGGGGMAGGWPGGGGASGAGGKCGKARGGQGGPGAMGGMDGGMDGNRKGKSGAQKGGVPGGFGKGAGGKVSGADALGKGKAGGAFPGFDALGGKAGFGQQGLDAFGGKGGKAGQSMGKGGGCQASGTHSNLFVGNLPEDITEQKLRDSFAAHGRVASSRVFTRNGRTCALVKMGTVQEAEQAHRNMLNQPVNDPKSRWLVKFADSDVSAGGAKGDQMAPFKGGGKMGGDKGGKAGGLPWGGKAPGMPAFWSGEKGGARRSDREQKDATPSENLYVKGLPPRVTDGQLHVTFSKVGKVVELKILRYGDSGDCAALVRMDSVESAKRSIETLNGTTPEGAVPPLTICFHGKDPAAESDNLYVKGLPLNLTQDHLHVLFGQCGTVRRSRVLPPAPNYAALDSAALVQMGSPDEAAKAIQLLNGTVPSNFGPQMVIRFAEPKTSTESKVIPSDNLYVKGLPLGTPDFLLRAVFVQFGTVIRLKVLEPRGSEALDCAALVQMSSVSEAKDAAEALHGRVLAAPLPPMRVRFAGKEQEPSANLYVAGLPTTIQEQQLRTTFSPCGNIVRLKLLVDNQKPETHALVQMGSTEEAQAAIDKLNNQPPESMGPTLIVRFATDRPKKEANNDEEDGQADGEEPLVEPGDHGPPASEVPPLSTESA